MTFLYYLILQDMSREIIKKVSKIAKNDNNIVEIVSRPKNTPNKT